MSGFLYAMHDFSKDWARLITEQGKTGWAVTTHAIGSDPNDRSGHNFAEVVEAGMTPIARLNNGYEPGGTIPYPQEYARFAERTRNFVAASPHCVRWIIGNETNLARERPGGPNAAAITARQYGECFVMCRNMIKQAGAQHQVIVGAVGPYNVQTGDWIAYWKELLAYIDAHGGADGLSIHAYLRNHTPNDVVSEERMQAQGYTDRHNSFRTYRDTMNANPPSMRHLPVYLTEVNPIPGWQDKDDGTVQAIYSEINGWNETHGNQKIKMAALFRWPNEGDGYHIVGNNGVVADFRKAVALNYISPLDTPAAPDRLQVVPIVSAGPQPPAVSAARDIDPAAAARGVKVELAPESAPAGFWRAARVRWLDTEDALKLGPDHHILGKIKKDGALAVGKELLVRWPSGEAPVISKADDKFGFNYDYSMSPSLAEYSIEVNDGSPSDKVTGIGMGKNGNKNEHTSTLVDWEWTVSAAAPVPQPTAPSPQPPAAKVPVPILVHPVPEPSMRTPSQLFGGNEAYYSQFKVDGVPLKGHNGLDFPTPVATPVRAVADGVVKEAWREEGGYGELLLLDHAWGQSLYAHLDRRLLGPGDTVKAGQIIALSGETGKVTAAHLHFGLRVRPFNRADGWGGYSDPLPYLGSAVGVPVTPLPPPPPVTEPILAVIDPVVAAAILEVESAGIAFGPGGRMVIRFEAGSFQSRVPAELFRQHFIVGTPAWKGEHHRFLDPADGLWKEFHGPINSHQQFEYKAFEVARKINAAAAYESLGMGLGQVMGFNARRIGYANAEQMFRVLSKSLPAQMLAFVNFVLTDDQLRAAMQREEFETVARLYNGDGQVAHYAGLMRAAHARLLTS